MRPHMFSIMSFLHCMRILQNQKNLWILCFSVLELLESVRLCALIPNQMSQFLRWVLQKLRWDVQKQKKTTIKSRAKSSYIFRIRILKKTGHYEHILPPKTARWQYCFNPILGGGCSIGGVLIGFKKSQLLGGRVSFETTYLKR